MSDIKRDYHGRFLPGGSSPNTRHGGEGAVKSISAGTPLVGLARAAELAVYDELESEGRYMLVIRNAARLQAAADLYWNAVATAAEKRDLSKLDAAIKRYGWLTSCSLRAWAQVRQERADDPRTLDSILDMEATR